MNLFTTSIACFATFLAGVVDAISGGGGVITLPALILLGLPADLSLATSKLVNSSGTALATWNFIRKGNYSFFVIKYNLLFTCVGAALGALCISYLDLENLKPVVSFLIILIALYFFFKPEIGIEDSQVKPSFYLILFSIFCTFCIGFYDGVFGPGTGAFLSFMFIKTYKQSFLLANSNTKILNLSSNLVALSVFIYYDKVIWEIGIPMACSNMIGGYVGSNIAIKKGSKWVRWIFIIMAVAVAIKQIL
jgi:uncharacterized membrane protein YfcA